MIKLKELITESFGDIRLFDCFISGEENGNSFTIYEFFSHTSGKGNAFKALIELKKTYKYIAVTDIGYPDDNSYKFWKYALSKKLVDEVNDDQGNRHIDSSAM